MGLEFCRVGEGNIPSFLTIAFFICFLVLVMGTAIRSIWYFICPSLNQFDTPQPGRLSIHIC